MEGRLDRLLLHFREALRADPAAAYRDWFRAQEELREQGDEEVSRALADDLWRLIEELSFASAEDRARFLHNAGVFYGSPGPSADLDRARELFARTLAHFTDHEDAGWRARALHNLGTALGNLGRTAADLEQSVGHFEEALSWRTRDREIARGVTLHNLGMTLRRLAELDPAGAREHLSRSARCLEEAVEIRGRLGLEGGLEASRRELEITLAAAAREGAGPPR